MSGVIHLKDVALAFTIKLEKGWYVASCPLLDVHSQATTRELAKSNQRIALETFFGEAEATK